MVNKTHTKKAFIMLKEMSTPPTMTREGIAAFLWQKSLHNAPQYYVLLTFSILLATM